MKELILQQKQLSYEKEDAVMTTVLRACLIVKFDSFFNAPIKFPSALCVISLTPLSFTPFVDFASSLVLVYSASV